MTSVVYPPAAAAPATLVSSSKHTTRRPALQFRPAPLICHGAPSCRRHHTWPGWFPCSAAC